MVSAHIADVVEKVSNTYLVFSVQPDSKKWLQEPVLSQQL